MNNLNIKQREEASERLKILGYDEDIQKKYQDVNFVEKLQETDSNDVPEVNIAPFLKMEEDEKIFTYLYRYAILSDGRLQLRLFFVSNRENEWKKERELLKTAITKGVDTEEAKDIFRTYVTQIKS